MPLAFLSFVLTAFILSLTKGDELLQQTSKPAFFNIAKSVKPPAEVFLCLALGSG
jgi:hypothetical protein